VLSADDNASIPAADVMFLDDHGEMWASATTDGDGNATLPAVGGYPSFISAAASGFGRTRVRAGWHTDTEGVFCIRLPKAVTLGGLIVDAIDGHPLYDARVRLLVATQGGWNGAHWEYAESEALCRSGTDGRFLLEGCALRPDPDSDATHTSHVLSIEATDHASVAMLVLEPQALRSGDLRIPVPRAGSVMGVVLGPDSTVVGAARVHLVPEGVGVGAELREAGTAYDSWGRGGGGSPPLIDLWFAREVESGPDGRFSISDLGWGERWRVEARADGWLPSEQTRVTADDAGHALTLRLRRGGRVVVRVTTSEGVPAAGASVAVAALERPGMGGRSIADSQGLATIDPVGSGLLRIHASAEGFDSQEVMAKLVEGGIVDIRVVLQACPPEPAATPSRSTSPAPREKAQVHIPLLRPSGSSRPSRVHVLSDRHSKSGFTVEKWPESEEVRHTIHVPCRPETTRIEFEANGYLPVVVDVSLRPGESVDLSPVTLDPGLPLLGRVLDELGRPMAHAAVWVEQEGLPEKDGWGGVRQRTRTADDGAFEVGALRPLPAHVNVQSAEGARGEIDVHVSPGLAPIEVRVPALAVLEGRVLNPRGLPVGLATVSLTDRAHGEEGRRVASKRTDRCGYFRFAVPAGSYAIVVRDGGRWDNGPCLSKRDISLEPGQTAEAVLETMR
jgi:hypothetical protein